LSLAATNINADSRSENHPNILQRTRVVTSAFPLLAVHRARQGFVVARTAQANQIRGLLCEFGITVPKGIGYLERQMPAILADADNGLQSMSREFFGGLFSHFRELGRQVDELELKIKAWHRGKSVRPTAGGDSRNRAYHCERLGCQYRGCKHF
jgi:transposase